ncbi:MAG: hypothetical protein RLZZ519_1993 [Bacteroidota bacterium]|jgi:cytochrome c2
MKRYTIPFLIFCAWFYVFKMTPVQFSIGEPSNAPTCGNLTPVSRDANRGFVDVSKGKIAFDANCARCHNGQLEKKGTGPALLGMMQRIPSKDWLYSCIRNSSNMIADGDPYAVKIWEENGKAAMDPFPALDTASIDAIVAWIDGY